MFKKHSSSKSKSKTKASAKTHHVLIGSLMIGFGLVLTALWAVPMSLHVAYNITHREEIRERQTRILAIYDNLHLPADYELVAENIFGRKIPYDWDSSRTYASSRDYVRNANVDLTTADLRARVEAAGWTFIDEPYPKAVIKELHFKSVNHEYLRMEVESKPRSDALRQNKEDNIDPNEGPSIVNIKVNLDDNNE
jgi:hypothetical protein